MLNHQQNMNDKRGNGPTYTYDPYSRLASVAQFNYTYLPHSDLIASVHNGNLQTTTTYEPHRNLKTSISNTFNGSPISSFDYTYDPIGRRIQRMDSSVTPNHFAYNPRSELTHATLGTNLYQYHYDPIGNRIHASANEVTNYYSSNELNQYTNITTTPDTLTYDLDGNMLSDGTWHYTWDAENRLVCAAPAGTNVESVCISFAYDYMSRRISKTTDTSTTTFLYDAWNLVRETQNNALSPNYYIWGLDLSNTLQGAGGVGGLLAQIPPNSNTLNYICDANGNVTELVDTNGLIVAHYEYDGFGNIIAQFGTHTNSNQFRFSSKYLDAAVRICYFGYRFYSPAMGRWLHADPLSEHAFLGRHSKGLTFNQRKVLFIHSLYPVYNFVRNNPVVFFDILGLDFTNNCNKPLWVLKDGKWEEVPPGETVPGDTDAVSSGPDADGNCSAYKWIDVSMQALVATKMENCKTQLLHLLEINIQKGKR